jgi:hypothetical protein
MATRSGATCGILLADQVVGFAEPNIESHDWRFRFLVALPSVQDLLLCAKHLFVEAIAWLRKLTPLDSVAPLIPLVGATGSIAGRQVYLVEVGSRHVPSCVVATDKRGRCPSSLPSGAVLHAARSRSSASRCFLVIRAITGSSRSPSAF